MKNRQKTGSLKNTVITAALFIAYFICYFLIVMINDSDTDKGFLMMGGKLMLRSCNGILTSLQMLICVIYAGMPKRPIRLLAFILPVFSIFSTSVFLFKSRDPEVLPGITMLTVTLLAGAVIFNQIRKRESEAFTDYLTGMHNRRSIMMQLEKRVKAGKPFGTLYIDIDNFKFINDNYGHETGDAVIKTVSGRISSLLDSKCVFGRIGGDEFIIITGGVNNINSIAEKVNQEITKEIIAENSGTSHFITVSIGIAKFPEDASSAAELTKCSDIAMYSVKSSGKNAVRCYNKKFEEELTRKTSIENLAKKYLSERSFRFEYQPQYYAADKKLRGFETLLRIKPEDHEMVSIQELVSIAEKSDIIYQIDEYVLKNALTEFKPNVLKHSSLTLSVNASARHISKKGFVTMVERVLEETGFPPECLEIEITEYCLAGSVNTTVENMKMLRELGIKLALDDFGTGFASLSYLSKLPVNLLKIDKSFVDELESENNSDKAKAFIDAIISMGHILGCEVISEGVESQEQLDFLRKKNSDFIQGYLWGTSLSLKMASDLCEKAFSEG